MYYTNDQSERLNVREHMGEQGADRMTIFKKKLFLKNDSATWCWLVR
jgi:hypothetical protein